MRLFFFQIMAKLLFLETATQVCSVALAEKGKLLSLKESTTFNSHSSLLVSFIQDTLNESKLNLQDLDAIVISKGPGSYTGLRIGVSSAKGLCYSLDIPLISVNTLQSIAAGMSAEIKDEKAIYCPMIDARRMEVYTALFDGNNKEIEATSAKIIDEHSFEDLLKERVVYFGGDGAEKCKTDLAHHQNAKFLDDFRISAKDMIKLAFEKYQAKKFEDVAYFEPYYLKDFIAGMPKVKGLK